MVLIIRALLLRSWGREAENQPGAVILGDMNARAEVFAWLKERGVSYVFGNPGSTEIPFLGGLEAMSHYVLALQESSALAMADGYAQASGQVGLVNLHTSPGFGHAYGSLFTAKKNKTPLIVTVGQQDNRQRFIEPLLSGNHQEMARPLAKWVYEPLRPEDVPAAFERAWTIAMSPPRGPVVLTLPMDLWEAESRPARVRQFYPPSVPQGLEKLLEALQNSKAPALVLGSGTGDLGFTVAPRLAEALNAPVFTESFTVVAAFPNRHPLYRGALPPAAPAIAGFLDPFDLVLVLGAPAFTVYPYLPGDLIGEQTQVYQISDDPDELGRSPASAVFMGDSGLALQWLAERIAPRGAAVESSPWPEPPAPSGSGLAVQTALPWLLNQLPPDAVLVDEGVTASPILQKHFPVTAPRSYFRGSSGGLGWGLPAAVGVALGSPGRPVFCFLGDGATYYSVQGLASAARENLPVKFVVMNNSQYAILKDFTEGLHPNLAGQIPGLDLPGLEITSVSRGLGVPAETVRTPTELAEAWRRLLAAPGPYLLELVVERLSGGLLGGV